MEARLVWLVKLVNPVTTISWGGEWMINTKVSSSCFAEHGAPLLRLGETTSIVTRSRGRRGARLE